MISFLRIPHPQVYSIELWFMVYGLWLMIDGLPVPVHRVSFSVIPIVTKLPHLSLSFFCLSISPSPPSLSPSLLSAPAHFLHFPLVIESRY